MASRNCSRIALIFSGAAITDYFDGLLARQKDMVSDFGKVMDPLADKLLVASTLIMLVRWQWVPAWAVCIIIGRELAVTGLRNIMKWMYPHHGWENTKPVFKSPPSSRCCSITPI